MSVYMVRAGHIGDVKIGLATNVVTRVKQNLTSIPHKLRLVRVLDGGRAEEVALHRRFASLRKAGEWFRPNDEMLKGDVGLPDLLISPLSKRDATASIWQCRNDFERDILSVIGDTTVWQRLKVIDRILTLVC